MDERYGSPHLIIPVERRLQPFLHIQQQARAIFANHKNAENLLHDRDKTKLSNYDELKALGARPILLAQTESDQPPPEWIHFVIQALGTDDSIRLFMRIDNVYVRGFANQYNGHELTQPGAESSLLLPLQYGCLTVEWDVRYTMLFGCTADELEGEFQRITADPNFVFDAVRFLSKYVHGRCKEEERKAKLMLGGIIFLLSEFLRVEMASTPGPLVVKAHRWGEISVQLLKWRARGFTDWITSRIYPDPPKENPEAVSEHKSKKARAEESANKPPKIYTALRNELKIYNEVDALRLIQLVMNRHQLHFDNLEKNKSKKKSKTLEHEGEDESPLDKRQIGQISTSSSDRSVQLAGFPAQPSDFNARVVSQILADGGYLSSSSSDNSFPSSDNSFPCGRRRIQILQVRSNFALDWVNFHDWHRPQLIFSRKHITHGLDDNCEEREQLELPLIGPLRPIGAYSCLGIEFVPIKISTTEEESDVTDRGSASRRANTDRGSIVEFWGVDSYDDEKTTLHSKEVYFLDQKKISVSYMIIPDAIEVIVRVFLFLGDSDLCDIGDGYVVGGAIKGGNSTMGGKDVVLFSKQNVVVPCREWTQLPLMTSLVCLPNTGNVDFNIQAHLTLRSCFTNRELDELVVSCSDRMKLSSSVTELERDVGRHKIGVSLDMSTYHAKL